MEKTLTEHDDEPGRADKAEPVGDRQARQPPSRIRRDVFRSDADNKKLSPLWIVVLCLILWVFIALAGYGLSRVLVTL